MILPRKGFLKIEGAKEGNLQNISLELPKEKLIVFTGVSGSGKSTLAMDVLYQECQRQYLEAMGYQGIAKPKVGKVFNASPAVKISQEVYGANPRSTVGTVTNLYTELRMIFEKAHERECPHCGERIYTGDAQEILRKEKGSFKVYMACPLCEEEMEKYTRSHFSFNTREGACETCQGIGETMNLRRESILLEDLSLEEGAVTYWDQGYKDYQINSLNAAFRYYGEPEAAHGKVKDFTVGQRILLLEGAESSAAKEYFKDVPVPKKVAHGKFEGILTTLWRRLGERGTLTPQLEPFFHRGLCPSCQGQKLKKASRDVTLGGKSIIEVSGYSLEKLRLWLGALMKEIPYDRRRALDPYIYDMRAKIQRLLFAGVGYLSLDRSTSTLSGGEAQRMKMSSILDATMTGLLYILDEPTMGLHPKDTEGILQMMEEIRDLGNTVILIEHDEKVMERADWIVDLGPLAGKFGGKVLVEGTLQEVMACKKSHTGAYLWAEKRPKEEKLERIYRAHNHGALTINHATMHNLKDLTLSIPLGVMTTVTGVSGSGKSTLVFDVLAEGIGKKGEQENVVEGLEGVQGVITVEQSPLSRMRRSNVATYSGLYNEVRKVFGQVATAKTLGLKQSDFSFNTKGGRCERCEGLGYVESNMLFFENIDVECPLCLGKQFQEEVLSVEYKGKNIHDVLGLSVEEAHKLFGGNLKMQRIFDLLEEVGLGYLTLGQSLTTLSGGEGQRLKLAKELLEKKSGQYLYLMDEPTIGLHPKDVEKFLLLLNRMVEEGHTVVLVEHNTQIMRASDWLIDLGPGGGEEGGQLLFMGTPKEMKGSVDSVTGPYL